jgi:putative endonuclease
MPSSNNETGTEKKTIATGRRYEEKAAAFFVQQGYDILERNWRAGRKEIDLIVKQGRVVAFVEVKAARTAKFGHPVEKVNEKKQRHLTQAARRYLSEREIPDTDFRFDVVTFVGGKLEHYPGAFEASD